MLATLINCIAVIAGSLVGLLVGKKLNDNFRRIVMTAAGLTTMVIGIDMALKINSYLVMMFSVVLGGFVGYALKIEDRVLALGNKFEKKSGNEKDKPDSWNFGLGFLNASVLFCSGAMAVVGSISAGTSGNMDLILLKSVMDGFLAIVFAATYGPGVMMSALFILVYQGFFTLAGGWLSGVLGDAAINELSAVGGILLLMIGFSLLEIKKFKTGNFLPALVLAPLMAVFIH